MESISFLTKDLQAISKSGTTPVYAVLHISSILVEHGFPDDTKDEKQWAIERAHGDENDHSPLCR